MPMPRHAPSEPRDVTEIQERPPFEEARSTTYQRTIVKSPGAPPPWEDITYKSRLPIHPPEHRPTARPHESPHADQAAFSLPRLVSLSPEISPDVLLRQPITHIGRAAENDVRLEHDSVSRCHARIERKPDGYYIFDLDSKNGVLIDDEPVKSARLSHGCTVEIGLVKFRFMNPIEAATHSTRNRLRIALCLLILALIALLILAYI